LSRLSRIEALVDRSGVTAVIEEEMPSGGRPRELAVRTVLIGILLSLSEDRPAHLTRVQRALSVLCAHDQLRLGVLAVRRGRRHLLTYRQLERTFSVIDAALGDEALSSVIDALLEASIPERYKDASRSLAIDWTDYESFSRPKGRAGGPPADKDASFGRRHSDAPGVESEIFFGYYGQVVTMVHDDGCPAVPELVRRIELTSCSVDPAAAIVEVLARMVAGGIGLSDVLCDCGYSHRVAETFALPLRLLGASLVFDLHPHDRGEKGTFAGAVICNGNLYCPATPKALLSLGPLARGAGEAEQAAHDASCAELARYKLGVSSSEDGDGHRRVACPALLGKLRCPLREGSMSLGFNRPTVLSPPEDELPLCCVQKTVTVPPSVGAKTRQRHDYPSAAHRRSYGRRTASERSFASGKDPAGIAMRRGWCRMMGRSKNKLMYALAFVASNLALVETFEANEQDEQARATAGLAPRARRRQRTTLAALVAQPAAGTTDLGPAKIS
jgi:hypothetical protein